MIKKKRIKSMKRKMQEDASIAFLQKLHQFGGTKKKLKINLIIPCSRELIKVPIGSFSSIIASFPFFDSSFFLKKMM